MDPTTKYGVVLLIGLGGLLPAAAGLWTLLTRHYIIGGKSLAKGERVYISPRERPVLFSAVVLIHLAAFCIAALIGSYLMAEG